jgi:type I restriction enzyme S subunit
MRTSEYRHEILASATGTTVKHTSPDRIYQYRFFLPPPDEQLRIVRSLNLLEQKLELHERLNYTLESLMRSAFKSWFIDFEPVRTKSEGNKPFGTDVETAGLFPDSFENSQLGEIPKGWGVGKLANIATNIREMAAPSSGVSSIYIGLEHMPKRCIALGDWGDSADMISHNHRFSKYDILFGKLRPYFHKVGIAPADGVCSTDILVVRPIHSRWLGFSLCLLSSNELVSFADSTSTGTKMPRTSWKDLAEYPIPVPPDSVVDAFENLVGPMIQSVCLNIVQSRTLADIRDTLIPKLLSGEMRVYSDKSRGVDHSEVSA